MIYVPDKNSDDGVARGYSVSTGLGIDLVDDGREHADEALVDGKYDHHYHNYHGQSWGCGKH